MLPTCCFRFGPTPTPIKVMKKQILTAVAALEAFKMELGHGSFITVGAEDLNLPVAKLARHCDGADQLVKILPVAFHVQKRGVANRTSRVARFEESILTRSMNRMPTLQNAGRMHGVHQEFQAHRAVDPQRFADALVTSFHCQWQAGDTLVAVEVVRSA